MELPTKGDLRPMMSYPPAAEDRRQLYLGLVCSVLLWTAAVALTH